MPPLPEPDYYGHLFSGNQLHEYGKSCRAQALAEAANIALNEKWVLQTGAHSIRFIDTYNGACDDCAQAIERLV